MVDNVKHREHKMSAMIQDPLERTTESRHSYAKKDSDNRSWWCQSRVTWAIPAMLEQQCQCTTKLAVRINGASFVETSTTCSPLWSAKRFHEHGS